MEDPPGSLCGDGHGTPNRPHRKEPARKFALPLDTGQRGWLARNAGAYTRRPPREAHLGRQQAKPHALTIAGTPPCLARISPPNRSVPTAAPVHRLAASSSQLRGGHTRGLGTDLALNSSGLSRQSNMHRGGGDSSACHKPYDPGLSIWSATVGLRCHGMVSGIQCRDQWRSARLIHHDKRTDLRAACEYDARHTALATTDREYSKCRDLQEGRNMPPGDKRRGVRYKYAPCGRGSGSGCGLPGGGVGHMRPA
jgi:hypothetical protein